MLPEASVQNHRERKREQSVDSEGYCAVWVRWSTWNNLRTQQKPQDSSIISPNFIRVEHTSTPTGHFNQSVDMRRDRLLVAIALVSLLVADIHFILLPRFRSWYHLPRDSCSCTNSSLESVPWTTSQNTTAVPTKLERLFNIRVPELGPEERLLEEDELVNYCKRKVSRWERYSTVFNKVFITRDDR